MTVGSPFAVTEESELRVSHTRSALVHLLHTVFGERWVGQDRFTATAEIDALHAALHVGPGAHVLDIGSGMGGPAIYLAQQIGCWVTGIDNSADNIRIARTAAGAAGVAGRVRFVVGDSTTATFPAGAFDAIVSRDAFVTMHDKARLFARCRRWLRPGGRMAATLIVNCDGLSDVSDPSGLLAWPIPTAADYDALARAAGLHILATDDLTSSFREVSARWRGALMVWELALISSFRDDQWDALRRAIVQLAEWATQGRIGQIRIVVRRDMRDGE